MPNAVFKQWLGSLITMNSTTWSWLWQPLSTTTNWFMFVQKTNNPKTIMPRKLNMMQTVLPTVFGFLGSFRRLAIDSDTVCTRAKFSYFCQRPLMVCMQLWTNDGKHFIQAAMKTHISHTYMYIQSVYWEKICRLLQGHNYDFIFTHTDTCSLKYNDVYKTLISINKGSPYSITEHKVPELISVLGSQPAGDVSHKPGGRLPLLATSPAVTLATLKRAATNFAAWWTEARWLRTVCLRLTRQHCDGNSNSGPSVPECSTQTTRLPSHQLGMVMLKMTGWAGQLFYRVLDWKGYE